MSDAPQEFHFLATADIGTAIEGGKRTLSGIAYAGGVITDHSYFNRVVFDLATTTIETPLPLLCNHDRNCVVGVITEASTLGQISISSNLFTSIDDEADEIAAKADAGMPWQLSVGIFPGEISEIQAGVEVFINGQSMIGPLTLFKNNRVREVSVVALGADDKTRASVFSAHKSNQPIKEDSPMAETTEHDDSKAVIAQLAAENTELKAALDATNATIAEFSAAKKLEQVKSLFAALERDYSDEAAAPYLTLADEQFSAISADLIASKPKAPDYLFHAQAVGDQAPNPDSAAKRLLNQVAGVN